MLENQVELGCSSLILQQSFQKVLKQGVGFMNSIYEEKTLYALFFIKLNLGMKLRKILIVKPGECFQFLANRYT